MVPSAVELMCWEAPNSCCLGRVTRHLGFSLSHLDMKKTPCRYGREKERSREIGRSMKRTSRRREQPNLSFSLCFSSSRTSLFRIFVARC